MAGWRSHRRNGNLLCLGWAGLGWTGLGWASGGQEKFDDEELSDCCLVVARPAACAACAAWHRPNLIQYSCVYNSNLHRNTIYINIYQTHLDSRYADTDDEKNIYLALYNVDD